jgi:hypothetical protein
MKMVKLGTMGNRGAVLVKLLANLHLGIYNSWQPRLHRQKFNG